MSDIINDGGVVYGSRTLTINAVTYATDDFTLTPSKTTIERTSPTEVPTGRVTIKGTVTGSATLQLATAATALPEFGQTFTEDEVTYVIDEVGRTETKGGETKVPISFYAKIGTVVLS